MAFKAKLQLADSAYDALSYDYSFHRDVDLKSRPDSNIYGGTIQEFKNGRCFRYSKNMSQSHVSYAILITAEEIKINGIDHCNKQSFL